MHMKMIADARAMDAQQIEQYGVSGAYTDTVATADSTLRGTRVPITLADPKAYPSGRFRTSPTSDHALMWADGGRSNRERCWASRVVTLCTAILPGGSSRLAALRCAVSFGTALPGRST
jgi:hypothetical protein